MNIYGNKFKTKDGTCVRDFIHVSDLAEAHIQILKKIEKLNKSIILNYGYGKGISVLKVIQSFIKISNKKIKICIKKKRSGDLATSVANNKKIKNFISWSPKNSSLKIMVKSCIKWERKLFRTGY